MQLFACNCTCSYQYESCTFSEAIFIQRNVLTEKKPRHKPTGPSKSTWYGNGDKTRIGKPFQVAQTNCRCTEKTSTKCAYFSLKLHHIHIWKSKIDKIYFEYAMFISDI